jgi:hypothetical protein
LFFQEEEEEEEEGDEEEEEEEEIVDLSICVYFNLSLDYARVSKSQEKRGCVYGTLSLCGRDQPHNKKHSTVVKKAKILTRPQHKKTKATNSYSS